MASLGTRAAMSQGLEGANVSEVRQHLDSPLRVGLTDGRVIVGKFVCLDKQRNILLVEAQESRLVAAVSGDVPERAKRHLGIVLVPRRWVATCHALEVA